MILLRLFLICRHNTTSLRCVVPIGVGRRCRKKMTLGDFERVSNELIRVKEENQELKKQQKEFIKYLEDERKRFLSNFNTDGIPIIEVELLDVVLENYKKIMGLKKWKKK